MSFFIQVLCQSCVESSVIQVLFVTVEGNVAQWKRIYDALDSQVVSVMNVSKVSKCSVSGGMQPEIQTPCL